MEALYWPLSGVMGEPIFPMNKKTFAYLIAIVISILPAAFAQVQPVVLTIHLDQPISKVSPTLYGLMTEEINYSYDGGLYAEMVRNRTFRSRRQDVPHWLLVEDGTAQAKMEPDPQTGPSEALPNQLSA
jgi:alpha-N-arabinofuranosidase